MGKIVTIYLSDQEAKDLKEFCEENRCTQYSALKTAVKQLLVKPIQIDEDTPEEIIEEPEEITEEFEEIIEEPEEDDVADEEIGEDEIQVDEDETSTPDSNNSSMLILISRPTDEKNTH